MCGVTLSQGEEFMSCYRGTQRCDAGKWGPCEDGEITEEPLPTYGEDDPWNRRPSALSTPERCNPTSGVPTKYRNPCDPSCMYYDEVKELSATSLGGAAGPLPDWSLPAGTASCAHELCTTGAVLSAACHPCVARVCAVDDTCCTGPTADTWDSDCVDLVLSECPAPSAPTPITLCDFAAFGKDSVEIGNGSSGFPTIGSTGWVTPRSPASLGPITAVGDVELRNSVTIVGDVITEGDVWIESPATVEGRVWAGGDVDVRNNVILHGDVTATGAIDLEGGAELSGDAWAGGYLDIPSGADIFGNARSVGNMLGQLTARIWGDATVHPPSTINSNIQVDGVKSTGGPVLAPPAPVVTLPDLSGFERDLSASCAVAALPPVTYVGSTVTLPPGVYGDYTVNGSGRLRLQEGGSYIFQSLRFNSNSQMWLDGTGPWDVSVCEDFHSDSGFKLYLDGTTTPPEATDFLVYADDTTGDCIYIGDNPVLNGMFIAPKCRVRVYNHATMTAALWGKSVYTNTGLNLTNIPVDDCNAANQWGASFCDGSVALYADQRSYSVGSRVHYQGDIYECANASLCSLGGGFGGGVGYWPGEGLNWDAGSGGAWYLVSPCSPAPADPAVNPPLSCPVDLSLPATTPPRSDCYTGLDCQVNSRCTEVKTGSLCAHSKCEVGAFLDAACDPCVARICDVSADCCVDTGAADWDAGCVALVETVCDASCGSVAPGCTHDACTPGVALDPACDPRVANVCGLSGFASCCDLVAPGAWDTSCVEALYVQESGSGSGLPALGESVCDYAVFGQGAAQLNSVTVQGNVAWASGSIALQEQFGGAGYASVSGDFITWGAATLYKASVGGDVLIGGAAPGTIDGLSAPPFTYSSVGGAAVLSLATVPSLPLRPTVSMTCPSPGSDNLSASGLLSPGIYGQIALSGDLLLEAGDYFFESLSSQGHRLILPADAAELVNIYVCQNVELHDGAEVFSPSLSPLQARLYSHLGVINLGGWGAPVTVYGLVQANAGTVTMSPAGSGVQIFGSVHSYYGTVQGNQGAVIDASGFSRDDCLLRGIDTSYTQVACPITTNLTSGLLETGACVDNGSNHQVTSAVCADADIAVGRSCGDQIEVCNHGHTDVPAGDLSLHVYPRAGQQFAVETPDPQWSLGTCLTTAPVPAGGCITQSCPASLVSEDLTVRAALNPAASVTECSELDNWSYYVEGDTCSALGSTEEVQVYEAVCPEDTRPRWGFLIWDTTLSGSATVTFEGRASDEGTFSGPYTPLGTAALANNTTDCTLTGPAPDCPVPLSSTLFPLDIGSDAPFLEVTITLHPSGADAPIVHEWGVTYTCRYDQ